MNSSIFHGTNIAVQLQRISMLVAPVLVIFFYLSCTKCLLAYSPDRKLSNALRPTEQPNDQKGQHSTSNHFNGILKKIEVLLQSKIAKHENFNQFPESAIPVESRSFEVNGWRWHTRIAVKEFSKFRQVSLHAVTDTNAMCIRLSECYDYTWSFIFIKLLKVETEVFFPFLKAHLPNDAGYILEEYERERLKVVKIGAELGKAIQSMNRNSAGGQADYKAIVSLTTKLELGLMKLQKTQDEKLIPYVAAYIPARTQHKVTSKVLSSLGLIDSQILMVAMYDVTRNDAIEYAKFRKDVPSYARALIPTWRRALLGNRAKCLDLG